MSKAKYIYPIIGTVGDEKATSDHGGRMKHITDDSYRSILSRLL